MTRSTPRATRLRRLTVLAIGVTAAITLSACGAGSDNGTADGPGADASPAPRGVVTRQTAEKVVDTYEKVNNRANKTRDEKLLATVEAGQVHEQSRADYKQWETWSKKERDEYGSPFSYTNRTYYLPAAGSATWFAVKATTTGDSKAEGLLIFDKVDGTYKLMAALAFDDKAIPEIAVDGAGLVTAADPAVRVGTLAPNQLPTAYEDLYETGGTKQGKQLATTRTTEEAVEIYRERDEGENGRYATTKYFDTEPAHAKVYALKLADGGVLAVFPTAHNEETLLKPQYMGGFQINPSKTEALYNPEKRALITDEYQGQALAVLPSKGRPRVTAAEYRMVDSR